MKLSDLTAENIRNTKIHLKSPEESNAFQEYILELGAYWISSHRKTISGKEVNHIEKPFITITKNLGINFRTVANEFKSLANTELQIDFTNKPNWSEAPELAQWLAQDENGQWFWFSGKPIESRGYWGYKPTGHKAYVPLGLGIPNPSWRETLEQRPNHISDAGRMDNTNTHEAEFAADVSNLMERYKDRISLVSMLGMLEAVKYWKCKKIWEVSK